MAQNRYIALTVDADAQPVRAVHDPLEELIWGRFGGEEFGIGRLMDIADSYGFKVSVYLDYCEFFLYGESLLDVAKEVVRRGHDAQIHLHTDLLPPSFAKRFKLNRIPSLDNVDRESAQTMAECRKTKMAVLANLMNPRSRKQRRSSRIFLR